MSLAATFLGGAKSRLLPASIPFRYFAAAAAFHCLAWALLLAGADELRGFQGGLGPPTAAVHLLTVGVLVMTAMGASFQLLPVATVQPLRRLWPTRAAFWLVAPGLPALVWGLMSGATVALLIGASAVIMALLIFAAVISANLWRARSMPVVAAHGWAALAALGAALLLAALLSLDHSRGFLPDHQRLAVVHFLLAAFGFMGLLALGFSYVLVPMFALSPPPPRMLGWSSLALALLALTAGSLAALTGQQGLLAIAALTALGAAGTYLAAMRRVWISRLRKRMGLSFVLVRFSWGMLMLSLLLALALAVDVPVPGGATLFGFLVLVGWLLTFLLAMLQRILPFLASMHAGARMKKPPLVSELTSELPLRVHATGHLVAVVLMASGLATGSSIVLKVGAFAGLIGSLAFAYFAFEVIRRLSARM
jgi:hypothetical protein